MSNATTSDRVNECAAGLLASGSLEMSPDRHRDAEAIAELLPSATRVYVNHLPRHGLQKSLEALVALRRSGLEPVPHIAARRVSSRAEVVDFLDQAVERAQVSKVLVIGGDDPRPLGCYADAAALLRDGVLAEHGVREVSLPGYPEGHPRIASAALEAALTEKLALAATQGLATTLVTQFSFAPARVVAFCADLARARPELPVYVGIAGPCTAATLLRFAQRCGVSASLRAMGAQGMDAVRLFMHTDPADQISAVAQHCLAHPGSNVVGAHLFSFGAAAATAEWMHRRITGAR